MVSRTFIGDELLMTLKLYYQDSYIKQFTANILEQGVDSNGRNYVILDQTAFYPTGGGQPHDTGVIAESRVVDVEITDEGKIIHYVDTLPHPTDAIVTACIDWNRRFDHMQQHTGQHILSAAFEKLYDADTVSFHLGRETVTVDIAKDPITAEQLLEVEQMANQIVLEQRIIQPIFVEKEDLHHYPLRNAPKVDENIRLVIIDDFDWSPCGGTHPSTISEIGPIKILDTERNKGGTRIEFICGWRVLRNMQQKQDILKNLQHQVSSGETELSIAVERLLLKNHDLEKELLSLRRDLLSYQAEDFMKQAAPWGPWQLVAKTVPSSEIKELQSLAKSITNYADMITLLIGQASVQSGTKDRMGNLPMVFARSQNADVPMNTLLKSLLDQLGGKGGGSPTIAQGAAETSLSPNELLNLALQHLEELKSRT
jgi:alanyl-tRNA synthetase